MGDFELILGHQRICPLIEEIYSFLLLESHGIRRTGCIFKGLSLTAQYLIPPFIQTKDISR